MRLAPLSPLLTALTAAAAALPAVAQQPSSFAFQSIPGVQASQVRSRGKILFARTGTELFAFSAATRRWVTEAIPSVAPVYFTNEWILTRDGDTWRAFGAQRGRFVDQQASSSAIFVNEATHRNDGLVVIQDGTDVHVFSGWTGDWSTLQTGPGASVLIGRDLALCLDPNAPSGPRAIAIRALDGLQVEQNLRAGSIASPPTASISDGLAVIRDDADLHAFSAYLDHWIARPVPANCNAPQLSRNTALWTHVSGAIAVGAQSLRFEEILDPPGGIQGRADHYAWFESQLGHVQIYSASLGTWTKVAGATAPLQIPDGSPAYAVFEGDSGVRVFSARVGGITRVGSPEASWTFRSTTLGAWSEPDGSQTLYSALTGQAVPVPAKTPILETQRSSTLLVDLNSNAQAFDARSGNWRPAPVRATEQWIDDKSALFAIADNQTFATFDPQRGRFRTHPRNGQTLNVQIWRTALLAAQGSELIGFSALHGTLETFDRAQPPNEVRASSELGVAIYADGVVGFSSIPDTTTPAQFPEFRRAIPAGSAPGLIVHGQPGALAAAFVGVGTAQSTPSTFGPLWLRGPIAQVPGLPACDNDGVTRVPLLIPADPTLIELEVCLQSLILPPQGHPYLTRPTNLRVH